MTYPRNDHGIHVPMPNARPGDSADFSHHAIPPAGSVPMPPLDVAADDIRDHAYTLIRVLDEEGKAVGPGTPTCRSRRCGGACAA